MRRTGPRFRIWPTAPADAIGVTSIRASRAARRAPAPPVRSRCSPEMRRRLIGALLTAVLTAGAPIHAFAQDTAVSPAEQRIAWARKAVDANAKDSQGYIDLALALARRA